MEPESSLPNSQVSATCPHPEQDQFSPYLPIPLLEKIYFNVILASEALNK